MSSLIFNLNPQQVIVATDTLAVTANEDRCYFTSKAYPVPHLNGIICVTGTDDFGSDWYLQMRRVLARDLHDADRLVTPLLAELGNIHCLDAEQTSTVYHFGYSEAEQVYVGYAYRSISDFQSERLPYGFGHKPGIADAKLESYPADIIAIMEAQRLTEASKPKDDRVCIGGDVHCYILADRSINIQIAHRFDDFDRDYAAMCCER